MVWSFEVVNEKFVDAKPDRDRSRLGAGAIAQPLAYGAGVH